MKTKLDTIVIGAGIAGLTLASDLNASGRKVMVLEQSDTAGGAIRTVQVDGFCIEEGPNSLMDTHHEVTALLARIGLEDSRVFAQDAAAKRYIVRNGTAIALPSSPAKFIRTSLFSWHTKLRLIKEPFIPTWDNRHEETVAGFVRRRLGDEFLDYAIDPFVAGVYAGDPARLSVQHAFPKLYALEQQYGSLIKGQILGARERRKRKEGSRRNARMYSFPTGLGTLPATLAAEMEGNIHTGATVVDVTHNDATWHVTYIDNGGNKIIQSARSVVYTGRLTDFSNIHFEIALDGADQRLTDASYPPVSVLGLGFRAGAAGHPLDGFGVLVPKVEKRHILGVLFSSTIFPDRAPDDRILLTVFVGGTRQPDVAHLDTDALMPLVMHDLGEILDIREEPVMIHRRTWPAAIPQYNVGYGRVKSTLQLLEENNPGLFFAGNYRNGISVPDTITNSLRLAQRMDAFLSPSQTT